VLDICPDLGVGGKEWYARGDGRLNSIFLFETTRGRRKTISKNILLGSVGGGLLSKGSKGGLMEEDYPRTKIKKVLQVSRGWGGG